MQHMSVVRQPDQQIVQDSAKLSTWLTRAMSSDLLKTMLGTDYENNRKTYNSIGGILINYGIATRDFSDIAIEKIFSEIKKSGLGVASSLIADFHKQNISMPADTSTITVMEEVLRRVEENCHDNGFYTHSFNGALIPAINENGLDMSQEMFSEEYRKFDWADSVHAKGALCLTPPSSTTFYYTHDVPERLLAGPLNVSNADVHTRRNGESTHEYYKRRLDTRLEWASHRLGARDDDPTKANKPIDVFGEAGVEDLRQAGMRMVDFYAEPVTAGIAIIPKQIFENHDKRAEPCMYGEIVRNLASYKYKENALGLSPELLEKIKKHDRYRKTDRTLAKILYSQVFSEVIANGKLQEFQKLIEGAFISDIKFRTDLESGDGYGIVVEGGKVPSDYFSISVVPEIDSVTAAKQIEAQSEIKPLLSFEVKEEILALRANYETTSQMNKSFDSSDMTAECAVKVLDELMASISLAWTKSNIILPIKVKRCRRKHE